jgi:hypothetical protein
VATAAVEAVAGAAGCCAAAIAGLCHVSALRRAGADALAGAAVEGTCWGATAGADGALASLVATSFALVLVVADGLTYLKLARGSGPWLFWGAMKWGSGHRPLPCCFCCFCSEGIGSWLASRTSLNLPTLIACDAGGAGHTKGAGAGRGSGGPDAPFFSTREFLLRLMYEGAPFGPVPCIFN